MAEFIIKQGTEFETIEADRVEYDFQDRSQTFYHIFPNAPRVVVAKFWPESRVLILYPAR